MCKMEFVKYGENLQTLIKWRPMDEKPEESGEYLVIWHTQCDTYEVHTIVFSKRYNLWGAYDGLDNAAVAVETANRGIASKDGKHLCGWYKQDFTECFKDEGGEF